MAGEHGSKQVVGPPTRARAGATGRRVRAEAGPSLLEGARPRLWSTAPCIICGSGGQEPQLVAASGQEQQLMQDNLTIMRHLGP